MRTQVLAALTMILLSANVMLKFIGPVICLFSLQAFAAQGSQPVTLTPLTPALARVIRKPMRAAFTDCQNLLAVARPTEIVMHRAYEELRLDFTFETPDRITEVMAPYLGRYSRDTGLLAVAMRHLPAQLLAVFTAAGFDPAEVFVWRSPLLRFQESYWHALERLGREQPESQGLHILLTSAASLATQVEGEPLGLSMHVEYSAIDSYAKGQLKVEIQVTANPPLQDRVLAELKGDRSIDLHMAIESDANTP